MTAFDTNDSPGVRDT